MRLRVPSIHLLLTAALLLLAVALRIADPEPVARLRLSVFDSYLNVAPRPLDETLPVRIVDIDEPSLAKVGQWPWPRTKLAAIIDALKAAGARTITLDLILAEPDRLSPGEFAKLFGDVPQLAPMIAEASSLPSNDDRLAAAIAGAPVTLGIAGEAGGSRKASPPHARFAFAGDDPQGFVPRFSGVIGRPAGADERRGGARRRQLDPAARSGAPPHSAAPVGGRDALSVAAARDAARRR